jgi:acyl-CoA dehydrogenase
MADRLFLDWPFFDESHRHLADRLEEWCVSELREPSTEDVDRHCMDLVKRLGAGGWLGYCVPAAYGGVHEELDVRSLAIIRETLARHSGLADFAFAMQGLGSGAITLFGTEEQKREWLYGVATGARIAAFALTEPNSGSDVASIETLAEEEEGGGWRVDGAKTYISNGGIADFYVLFARTGEAPGAKGISSFIVEAGTPGLEVAERIRVIAPHPLATLRFSDMRLPKDALLGGRGRGFAQAMATLDVFRTTVGAAALGFARRALDEATERALTRRLGSGTLADNPITQSKLAEMVLDIEASALLVYRAAWLRDVKRQRNSREAALAKLHATDSAQSVIDKAVQMFGGLGVTSGVIVESLYREIRALRIYEGASEVQKVVIARAHLRDHAR